MFRASSPVTSGAFHNRSEALERVLDAFASLQAGAPRWLAVLGPRKVGKTSLLLEAARRSSDMAVARMDIMRHAPLTLDFFRTLALEAVDALLAENAGGSLVREARKPAEYRALLQRSSQVGRLSASLRTDLLQLPEEPADVDAVRHWLQLPEDLAVALNRQLVMVLDEVQELANLSSSRLDPFPVMRAIWQQHQRVAYVISGSAPSMLRELVTSRHSPFFQHFQLLELGPFTHDDAIELLVSCAPQGRAISRSLAVRIVEIIGTHPFYLQLVGETLTACLPPYDESTLKPVLQELIFSRTGRLSLYFQNIYAALVGRAATAAATLQAVAAHAPARQTDIAKAIAASSASTARYIERLGDAIVRQEDGRYALADPLFAKWVRWRSPGGTVVPMTVIGDEAEIAVATALSSLGFDLIYQSRASRGSFDLLAVRGPDQLGLQVKRSALPLRFKKREWARMHADAERLGWRWAIVAVDKAGKVAVLDPAQARSGREIRLHADAAIDNVLLWMDS